MIAVKIQPLQIPENSKYNLEGLISKKLAFLGFVDNSQLNSKSAQRIIKRYPTPRISLSAFSFLTENKLDCIVVYCPCV